MTGGYSPWSKFNAHCWSILDARRQPRDTATGHAHLKRLLDGSRFVGIRVFDREEKLVFDTWADVPTAFIGSAQAHRHTWPGAGESHRNWIEVAGERLIQVVLPLHGQNGSPTGYLEGIYRLDQETLQQQQQQIRGGVLSAILSVAATAALVYPLLIAMLQHSAGLSRRLLEANLSLLHSLGSAIAKRDSDTDAHNYRVTLYAVALAEAMGLPDEEIPDLVIGALLHDVGKIGIPDHILLKPGKLTDEEFRVMKTHAQQGFDIVAGNPWMTGAAEIIRHHHEWFDGSGYPDGLQGEAIPRHARIFAVVDVFDALTSIRPYKKAMSLIEALEIIERDSGRHFDPAVVRGFKQVATDLHDRIAQASEGTLYREMCSVLCRFFKTEAALEGAAQLSTHSVIRTR